MNKRLELLAPVGSFESLKAAVQNGANAVYLGGGEFSARASANNFDREELKKAIYYAHIRDCKVFITVNTLIKESEVDEFIEYIDYLYKINVDALILQDIGMAYLIKEKFSNFELHASTQMAAHSLNDVLFLEKIGFKRVVLARELNIDEIRYIVENCNVDIEVFVHGALCVCYSGQCLMSSEHGTRSGNRGRCAQPCRQKYKMYNVGEKKYIDTNGDYLLSPRDLNTIENIGRIIDTNVLSLKIEGRMKRPEYVATVVSSYRDAISEHLNGKSTKNEDRVEDLYTIFNRKFTDGYILGETGSLIMNYEKPNNRGLYIGKSVGYNKKLKRLKIMLEASLKKGDGLNIGGGNVGRIIAGTEIKQSAESGEIIEIDYIGNISKGTEIYKTSDSNLLEKARRSYEEKNEKIIVDLIGKVSIKIGIRPKLEIKDKKGNSITVESDKIVESAINIPLTIDKVEKQMNKLGYTPYYFEKLDIELDNGVSIPISELNELRRRGISEISNERALIKGRKAVKSLVSKDVKRDYQKESSVNGDSVFKREVNISCRNLDQLKAVLDLDINDIYYRDINTLGDAINLARKFDKKIYYYFPRIIRSGEDKVYTILQKIGDDRLSEIEGFKVSNYGEIFWVTNNYPNQKISVSEWLNVYNSLSIEFYKDLKIEKVCLSQETSINQIEKITKYHKQNLEYRVFGSTEMMISEYCPMGVIVKDCHKDKRNSLCSMSDYMLESEEGRKFRLLQDENCRTTIYSDEKLNLIEELERLDKLGVKKYEISLVFEDEIESKSIVSKFIESVKRGKKVKVSDFKSDSVFSLGHLYKEID